MVTLKTDWVDGEILSSKTTSDPDGLNGITNEINRKGGITKIFRYSSAAEVSRTGSTDIADTVKTFDVSGMNGARIISAFISADLDSDNASGDCFMYLKMVGATTGTKYLIRNAKPGLFSSSNLYFSVYPEVSTSQLEILSTTDSSSYKTMQVFNQVKLNSVNEFTDDTITFTVQIKVGNAIHTAYIKNVEIIITFDDQTLDVTP